MSYTAREETCSRCGKTFLKKAPRSVRCPECQRIQRNINNRTMTLKRYHERAAKKQLEKQAGNQIEKDPKLADPKVCRSCRFRGRNDNFGNKGGVYCDYLSATGRSRQSVCPAGACTVYEKSSPRKAREDITLKNE